MFEYDIQKTNTALRKGQFDLRDLEEAIKDSLRHGRNLDAFIDAAADGFNGNIDELLAHIAERRNTLQHITDKGAIEDFMQCSAVREKILARAQGEIDGYLRLEDISYDDGFGNTIHHPVVYVAKDIPRRKQPAANGHTYQRFTSYQGIAHFQGLESAAKGFVPVLPTYRLSVAIVKRLLHTAVRREQDGSYTTLNEEHKKVLDQYTDYGSGFGWHGQNTIIDGHKNIIDLPKETDFPENNSDVPATYKDDTRINGKGINEDWQTRRIPIPAGLTSWLGFNMVNLAPGSAEYQYSQKISGETPAFFIEWAQYYKKKPFLWTPDRQRFNSAWLGCGNVSFYVYTGYGLGYGSACRGVFLSAEGALRRR